MPNHNFCLFGCLILTWYTRWKKMKFRTDSQRDGKTAWGDQKEITCACGLAATSVVLGSDWRLSSWCGGGQTWVTCREAESLSSTRKRRPFLNYNLRDPRSFKVCNFRAKRLFPPNQIEYQNFFFFFFNAYKNKDKNRENVATPIPKKAPVFCTIISKF